MKKTSNLYYIPCLVSIKSIQMTDEPIIVKCKGNFQIKREEKGMEISRTKRERKRVETGRKAKRKNDRERKEAEKQGKKA